MPMTLETTSLPKTTSRPQRANAPHPVALPNDADAMALPLEGVERVDLHFPSFTDGLAEGAAIGEAGKMQVHTFDTFEWQRQGIGIVGQGHDAGVALCGRLVVLGGE